MIDRETLQSFIINTSRAKFSSIARLILREVFGLDTTDVDGKGDGGGDLVIIPQAGGPRAFVSQVTVQKGDWKAKALADAKKAVRQLACTRYFYLTNRGHESTAFREVENSVTNTYGIPATCLGGREIADMIVERNLVSKALDALEIPLIGGLQGRLDHREILLHSYVALGQETADLRDQVYDDSLLLCARDAGPQSIAELVDGSIRMLGCDIAREGRLRARVNGLLSRRLLVRDREEDIVGLSESSRQGLADSERIYLSEMEELASSQAALIEREFGIEWPPRHAQQSAVLLARAFIQRHLETIASAGNLPGSLGLLSNLGDPIQELRDYLSGAGVPLKSVQRVVEEFASNAADLPLIHKLTKSALYVVLEGRNPLQTCRSLGVSNWSEVVVIVDASVLIPFLCARLFGCTQGRFSRGAIQAVESFGSVGARIVTTQDYINEAAAHLLKALDYRQFPDEGNLLQFSRNGYVEHYFRLRSEGAPTPDNLASFLSRFSKQVLRFQEASQWVRSTMVDIQSLARSYGVRYEHVKPPGTHISDVIDREYAFQMHDKGSDRVELLAQHDALTLSHMRKMVAENGGGVVCLTWDRLMIEVGRKVGDCGWVVSPHDASDFVHSSQGLRGETLMALSHRLASVRERPEVVVGAILDELAKYAKDRIPDWQMRDILGGLQRGLLERMNAVDPNFESWARQEAEAAFAVAGVEDPKRLAREIVAEAGSR